MTEKSLISNSLKTIIDDFDPGFFNDSRPISLVKRAVYWSKHIQDKYAKALKQIHENNEKADRCSGELRLYEAQDNRLAMGFVYRELLEACFDNEALIGLTKEYDKQLDVLMIIAKHFMEIVEKQEKKTITAKIKGKKVKKIIIKT